MKSLSADHVASLNQTYKHLAAIANFIAPQGKFGLTDDPERLNISVFKNKSVSVHWAFMFTKSILRQWILPRKGGIVSPS
ncbi:hypothetical protein B1F84_11985 [Pseudoalteromonas sp. DL-6]|nr:hypothetical protein B1F84_11985 [Pseudoalteromonas sp. DL-6]